MNKFLFFLFFTFCLLFQSQAQDLRVSITPSFNIPLGKMTWSYKPAPGINLSMHRFNDSGHWTKGFGVAIGYLQFNPIADTLFYVVDKGGVDGVGLGKAVYSPFKIFTLSASIIATRDLNKKLGMEFGMDVGYYYGKRDISFTDSFGASDDAGELIGRGTLVPRLGLRCNLNDNLSVTPYVSYSFMVQLGNTNPASMNYNADTGQSLSFYSTGLSFNILF
jgi:hypothetical protein